MYDLSVDERGKILEIRFTGAVSFDEHVAARQQALEICRQHALHKILVDARELKGAGGPGLPSILELFNFGASWPALAQCEGGVLLAGVLPRDPQARQWLSFGADVAANHGFRTTAFEDLEGARAWLLRMPFVR